MIHLDNKHRKTEDSIAPFHSPAIKINMVDFFEQKDISSVKKYAFSNFKIIESKKSLVLYGLRQYLFSFLSPRDSVALKTSFKFFSENDKRLLSKSSQYEGWSTTDLRKKNLFLF